MSQEASRCDPDPKYHSHFSTAEQSAIPNNTWASPHSNVGLVEERHRLSDPAHAHWPHQWWQWWWWWQWWQLGKRQRPSRHLCVCVCVFIFISWSPLLINYAGDWSRTRMKAPGSFDDKPKRFPSLCGTHTLLNLLLSIIFFSSRVSHKKKKTLSLENH